jgi:hypothetical protein
VSTHGAMPGEETRSHLCLPQSNYKYSDEIGITDPRFRLQSVLWAYSGALELYEEGALE